MTHEYVDQYLPLTVLDQITLNQRYKQVDGGHGKRTGNSASGAKTPLMMEPRAPFVHSPWY